MHTVGESLRGLKLLSHKGRVTKVMPYGFMLSGCDEELIYGFNINSDKANYKSGEYLQVGLTKKAIGLFISKIKRL